MYNTYVTLCIILVYFSLFMEIVFFSVPSVASTSHLFSSHVKDGNSEGLLGSVRSLSFTKKMFILLLPSILGMAAFYIPIVLVFFPAMKSAFLPIEVMEQDYILVSGILLAAAGRGISVSAVPRIRGLKGHIKTDVSLITGGVFSMSRNPIALGMILTFLGLFLVAPSFIVFTGFLIFTVNMHFRILLEEDFMRRQFGHEYEDYLRRTRRYL